MSGVLLTLRFCFLRLFAQGDPPYSHTQPTMTNHWIADVALSSHTKYFSDNMKIQSILLASFWVIQAQAQSVLFDFENANRLTPLPISLTVGGITAQFSGTGQGYSIQAANTMGFTPVGFSGNCIYPSSIYASDLIVTFSTPLTDFSILYAPHELACDSSATMRVTAYLNGVLVGTATTNAQAGTWPTETIRFSSAQGFDNVVLHYDKPPPTGGDYGTIFMADNMMVTPALVPFALGNASMLSNGAFQFSFSNISGKTFTVLGSTNSSLPLSSWYVLGTAKEVSSGSYQFVDLQATNRPACFYRVRSP